MHEALGKRARCAVANRFESVASLHQRLARHEIHPLFFAVNNSPEAISTLWRPVFKAERLQRIAKAVWGHIDDEDLAEWRSRFTIVDAEGLPALRHMVANQLSGSTPLQLGGRYMNSFEQAGGFDGWRHLFVFERGSFDELVYFWNLRSRMSAWNGERAIAAITTDLLKTEELAAIRRWAEAPNAGSYFKPDLCLAGPERAMEPTKKVLKKLGFKRTKLPGKFQHSFPDPPAGREQLEYTEYPLGVGGPMKRGVTSTSLVTISSKHAYLALPKPTDPKLPFGYVRLTIRGLPLPLPLNRDRPDSDTQCASIARRLDRRNEFRAISVVLGDPYS